MQRDTGLMERVFLGASVRTMDPEIPCADTVIVRDRQIVQVCRWGEMDPAPAPGTDREVYDLRGMAILPGFVDAHIHFTQMVWERSLLDFSNVGSLGQLRDRLASARRERGSGEWIIGRRINPLLLDEIRDGGGRIVSDGLGAGPVILGTADGHTALLDAKGAEILHADHALATIPDRSIEPNGDFLVFKEEAASAAWEWIETREKALVPEAIEDGLDLLHSRGITAIHTFERIRDWPALGENGARRRGLRTAVGIYEADLPAVISSGGRLPGNELALGGLKLFIDGTLGSRTALLFEPWEGEARGSMTAPPPARHSAIVRRARRNGIGLCLHAIGDRAVRVALDLLQEAAGEGAGPTADRIEHVQLIHPADLGRFGGLGVIASVQPAHIIGDRQLAEAAWGRRCRWAYPYRSLIRSGARLAFGSDAPYGETDPLQAIRIAVTRRAGGGEPWYPEERISVEEAFTAHTVNGAVASGWERDAGRLIAGLPADMVVLSRDPFRSETDLEKTEVVATVVGGEAVWGLEKLPRFNS